MLKSDSPKGAKSVRTAIVIPFVLALAAAAAWADPLILEAEDFVASFNAGGAPIYVTYCSGASGGYAVEGYDYPGDFIELRADICQAGDYEDILRSGGELYEWSEHFVRYRVEGGSTIAFATFATYGMGIG
jgi:hypothetical protein